MADLMIHRCYDGLRLGVLPGWPNRCANPHDQLQDRRGGRACSGRQVVTSVITELR